VPNWTSTTLTLRGNTQDLQRFLAECFSDGNLDFTKIIPFPEGFDPKLEAGSQDAAYDVVHGDWETHAYPWVREAIGEAPVDREAVIKVYADRYEAVTNRLFATFQDLADAYKRNVDLTGCKTWYEWCCENWGTKWNACASAIEHDLEDDLQEHEVTVQFETAWCEPMPIFEALHEKFPRLFMQYTAEHEGDDEITGRKWWPEEDGA
jgi:hypothetical protein